MCARVQLGGRERYMQRPACGVHARSCAWDEAAVWVWTRGGGAMRG